MVLKDLLERCCVPLECRKPCKTLANDGVMSWHFVSKVCETDRWVRIMSICGGLYVLTLCEAGHGKDLQNVGDTTHSHTIAAPKRSSHISLYLLIRFLCSALQYGLWWCFWVLSTYVRAWDPLRWVVPLGSSWEWRLAEGHVVYCGSENHGEGPDVQFLECCRW